MMSPQTKCLWATSNRNMFLRFCALLFSCLFCHATRAADVLSHFVESEYQNGKQEIRVLLPDNYSKDHSYRVLYVLPVEKGFKDKFGSGLSVLRQMDSHNRYNIIVVQMGFEKEPWYGDHATDAKVRQASFVKDCLVPFIEERYSTLGTPEGRLLFGFSKSGWGAVSLIMTYSDFFGYAASWDAPLMFDRFHYGMESVYGTLDQLRKYQLISLAAKQKAHFSQRTRLVLTGEKLWGTMRKTPTNEASHTVEAHRLLEKQGIKHFYDNTLDSPHRWDKSWMEPTLAALMQLTQQDPSVRPNETEADVVIYGGTSAGVMAAVQVRRMGKSCVLIEPGRHLGGLSSSGLGRTDADDTGVIGGLAREFYQRIKRHYDDKEAWVHADRNRYKAYKPESDAMFYFEPHVAEKIFDQLAKESGATVVRGERLDRKSGVIRDGQRITGLRMESGKTYKGKMFIDASYEGDLLPGAGVTYTTGREANSLYKETLNGAQAGLALHHQLVDGIDPWKKKGDPKSGLLLGIGTKPGPDGTSDKNIQAYNFRMCLTDVPENRVPFAKPDGYNEERYELLFRNFEAGETGVPLFPTMMPNRKTDTNNRGGFSTDFIGANHNYPEASYAEREQIVKDHVTYQKGLMWTLANHPRVPVRVRKEVSRWGLAKDEFVDNGNWPHQIYVREARRMVADYVVTEHDCRRRVVANDPVGMGNYNMDSHNTGRYVTTEGTVKNEGNVEGSPRGSYLISYRAIVPRKGEAENLLVPVCLSASHIAFGSIRMEPVFMILGQSAGTAAALSIDDKCSIQALPYAELARQLRADGQNLDLPESDLLKPDRKIKDLAGIVVDDEDARVRGSWRHDNKEKPYVGGGYLHDQNGGKGARWAWFDAELTPGRYEVRLACAARPDRAVGLKVVVTHAGGETNRTLDLRKASSADSLFHSLGEFDFKDKGSVYVNNRGSHGFVILDAVQYLPVKN